MKRQIQGHVEAVYIHMYVYLIVRTQSLMVLLKKSALAACMRMSSICIVRTLANTWAVLG